MNTSQQNALDVTMVSHWTSYLTSVRDLISRLQDNDDIRECVLRAASAITECFSRGGKLLLAGNGGSAADAQHMAAEYVSRFMYDRPGLPAIALTTDTSILTAVGNDYGFETVFTRQLQALGQCGDVYVCYSTSGRSQNVLHSLAEAKSRGLLSIGFTGDSGGHMHGLCDVLIKVPSSSTPHIQEGHLVLGHMICGMVERALFPTRSD